jgi:excisionase family DNA binding protein
MAEGVLHEEYPVSQTADVSQPEWLLFTVPEAAERLRLSVRTVHDLVARGELKAIRIRTSVRIHRRELERYLANLDATQNGSSRRRPRPAVPS